jgi:hypothetical protein
MDCPNCRLVNPPTATRCDCGYDFQLETMREPHLVESDRRVSPSTRSDIQTAWLCLFTFLALCLLPWFFLFGLSGMAGDSGNPLKLRNYLFLAWVWSFPLTLAAALIFRRRIPALILLPLLHAMSFFLAGGEAQFTDNQSFPRCLREGGGIP